MLEVNKCEFRTEEKNPCHKDCMEGEKFCENHVIFLTRLFGQATIDDIIVEHLGVNHADLIESASISNELGGDSLDAMEIVMAIEEAFSLEIGDDVAKGFSCLKDIKDYVMSEIIDARAFRTYRLPLNYSSIRENVEKKLGNIRRKTKKIFSSKLYIENLDALELNYETVSDVVSSHLDDGWIDFHTSIPVFEDGTEELLKCHVIFLSQRGVLYISLSLRKFSITLYLYKDVSMKWTYKANEKGRLVRIDLDVTLPENTASEGRFFQLETFYFKEKFVPRAMKFLEKYVDLSAEKAQ